MPKQKNLTITTELKEKVNRAKSLVLTDYRGLTHKQSEELHRTVKKVGGEYLVVKNSLLRLSTLDTDFKLLATDLAGTTAALLAYEDELAPLKEVAKFAKTTSLPKFKLGLIGGTRYDDKQLDSVAKLPGKEVLQGMVVSRLSGPMYGLLYTLNGNLNKLVYVLSQIKK